MKPKPMPQTNKTMERMNNVKKESVKVLSTIRKTTANRSNFHILRMVKPTKKLDKKLRTLLILSIGKKSMKSLLRFSSSSLAKSCSNVSFLKCMISHAKLKTTMPTSKRCQTSLLYHVLVLIILSAIRNDMRTTNTMKKMAQMKDIVLLLELYFKIRSVVTCNRKIRNNSGTNDD